MSDHIDIKAQERNTTYQKITRIKKKLYKVVYSVVEILLLLSAYVVAHVIYNDYSDNVHPFKFGEFLYLVLMTPIWLILLNTTNLNKIPRVNSYFGILFNVSRFVLLNLGLMLIFKIIFAVKSVNFGEIFIYTGIVYVALYVFRVISFKFFSVFRASGHNSRNIVIIADDTSEHVIDSIIDNRQWGFRIAMILTSSDSIRKKYGGSVRILPSGLNIVSLLQYDIIDDVLHAKSTIDKEYFKQLVASCHELGVTLRIQSDLSPLSSMSALNTYIDDTPFLTFANVSENKVGLTYKSIMEAVVSLLIMICISPLFLLISVLLKIDSKGPVFFKQERVGLRGRKFYIYKFRSMVVDAEELKEKLAAQNESDGPVFKMKHDPRITKMGRLLRKTNMDELPQLINVIKGEMSLIGPRPPVPKEVAKYERWQLKRLSMKPGITCTWQIQPHRNEILFDKWMKLDIQYIENWSLKNDLKLLIKTIKTVLSMESY
ncbi:sugar transferase [Bacteroidales bacterium]|nr:sugar transferase [Bacteroidales bacterium]